MTSDTDITGYAVLSAMVCIGCRAPVRAVRYVGGSLRTVGPDGSGHRCPESWQRAIAIGGDRSAFDPGHGRRP